LTSPNFTSWFITVFIMFDGDREADADVAAGAGEDGAVDAHQPALRSTSAPPELPGLIDASVWMKVFVTFRVDARAAECAHDAGGHGVAETEGIADRDDEVTDLGAIGVGHGYLRQVRCLDLQNGYVRAWILAHYLGGEGAVVEQA
jgi:hypothetical protein